MPPPSHTDGVTERPVTLTDLGVETRVLDAGTGAPVVLLHGNPDNADGWLPLIGRLRTKYRCLAPDFPGYGKSPEPPPSFTYSIDSQIAFLDGVLEAMNVREKMVLVVHDIGGMLGVPWTAKNPERVHGLMVTNTVAFEGFEWFDIARRWGNDSLTGRLRANTLMWAIGLRDGDLFKQAFWEQSPQLSEAQIDQFVNTFALNPAAKNVTLRQFRQIIQPEFFSGFDEMLKKIGEQTPTRVLWGDGDPYVPVRYAHAFPNATVTILPDAGHWVPITATEKLAEEIEALWQQ